MLMDESTSIRVSTVPKNENNNGKHVYRIWNSPNPHEWRKHQNIDSQKQRCKVRSINPSGQSEAEQTGS